MMGTRERLGHVSELYDIVQRHQDRWGPSAAEIARRIGAQPQTVSAWKTRGLTALPEKRFLVALAELTHTPYGDVLTAALRDCGYLPLEPAKESAHERPTTTESPAVEVTADLDESGQGRVTGRAKSRSRDRSNNTR